MTQQPPVTRPLSELSAVDWARLNHAYGPAHGVPALLRRLEAGDEHADFDLCSFLWHQGTVYSATAPAIPFLLALLEAGHTELLGALDLMAHGHGYWLVHERDPRRRESPEMQATFREEQGWIDAAREAVARGLHLYRPLLTAPDAEVRIGAAGLLAVSAVTHPEALDGLAEAFRHEPAAEVQAALLAAAYREGCGPRLFRSLAPDLNPAASPDLRFWQAALCVQAQGPAAPPEAVEELFAALSDEALYVDRTVAELAGPLGLRERFVQAVLARQDVLRDPYALLDLFRPELPWQPQTLPPLLRAFFLRYLEQEQVSLMLDDYGLPNFPDKLRRWLDG